MSVRACVRACVVLCVCACVRAFVMCACVRAFTCADKCVMREKENASMTDS